MNTTPSDTVSVEGGIATFKDTQATDVITTPIPNDTYMSSKVDMELVEFLKRPVKIGTYSWNVGGLGTNFDPLTAFLTNVAVARKLSNFKYLKTGGLRIIVVSNGTPYLYGRLGVAWWPHETVDTFDTNFSLTSAKRLSTLPCFFEIDPSQNQVQEICVPEFLPTHLDITAIEPSFGILRLLPFTPLASAAASGVDQYCDITIYACMIKPELSLNTYVKAFHPTSGEYKGIISKPLKTVSDISNMLVKAPVIGPYMTSFGQAALLGSKVAAWFGFSKPLSTVDAITVINHGAGNLVNTEGLDTCTSLTFSKTAQTIMDPAAFGLPADDELIIHNIISRWSLATNFNWSDTDGVDAELIAYRVGPNFGYTGTYPCAQTNLGYVSSLFNNYRGSIVVRVKFCVSKFHTGRMQIFYDPSGSTTYPTDATNNTMNWIVDLSDGCEIDLTLPFANTDIYANTQNAGLLIGHTANDTPSLLFKVLNKVRAGSVATTVPILLYVKAGDDFELINPTMLGTRNATEQITFMPTDSPDAPPTNTGYRYYGTSGTAADADDYPATVAFATERILSIRQLLKRYQVERIVTLPLTGAGPSYSYTCLRDYPSQPGYSVNGTGSALVLNDGGPHSAITWFGPSFVGWRGSIKTKLIPISGVNSNKFIIRGVNDVTNYNSGTGAVNDGNINKIFGNFIQGAVFAKLEVPANFGASAACVGSAEVPEVSNPWSYQKHWQFVTSFNTQANSGTGLIVQGLSVGDETEKMLSLKAVGDDFQFLYYKGPPILYKTTFS